MKRQYKYITLIFALCIICNACYKDQSTLANMNIPDIVVDTTNIPENLIIGFLDPFTISPKITENGVDAGSLDLLYEWRINILPGKALPDTILSTERVFNGFISNPISSNPYYLSLRVTDPKTGIIKFCSWNITVVSSFLDGLLVSDSKDGNTSDFTLIMDKNLTNNWSGEGKIIRNILESSDQGAYNGLLDRLYYYRYVSSVNYMFAFDRNNRMVRFATLDFTMEDMNKLFVYFPPNLSAYSVCKPNQELFLITSEGVTIANPSTNLQFTGAMNIPLTASTINNNVVAVDSWANHGVPAAIWYDKPQGCFYWFYFTMFSPYFSPFPDNPSEPFNAGVYKGKTALAGGLTYDANTLAMLMKDDQTGNYEICTFYKDPGGGFNPGAQSLITIPAAGKTILDNAIGYVFAQKQPVLYVIESGGIYAITFGVNPANVATEAKFTAPAGEQIVLARLFEQGRYKHDPSEFQLPLNTNALIAATSSATGGKVYVIPMINLGTGNLDANNKLVYDGFGQILDVLNLGY